VGGNNNRICSNRGVLVDDKMNELIITIPGNPIAKKRPRFARRGKFVTTYNDQESEEGKLRWNIMTQLPQPWTPIKNPIKIITVFYMKRPKSHYGSGKNVNILKNNAPLIHLCKPDLDNLQKMVYDCFNQLVWVDDSLVCETYSRKEYSDNPRIEIIISEAINHGQRAQEGC
jgi:Holliday junction resolvase RusA-like endonuclease